MEIVKQTDLIDKISAQYRPYIEALRTPTLKDSNRVDNLKAIYTALITATTYCGSKNEDNGANKYLSEKFYEEVFIKYPYARHGEIMLAFKKGALKEYGDYFGINIQTLYGWFKKYLASDELLQAKRQWAEVRDNEIGVSDKPLCKIFEVNKDAILSIYRDYLSSGNIPTYGRIYYDAICKIKGVKTLITDNDLRDKIRKEVDLTYKQELIKKKVGKETFEMLINSFDKDNRTFESISKRIALREYFNACKLTNTNPV